MSYDWLVVGTLRALAALIALAIIAASRPAEACSCLMPPPHVISPRRGAEAPLNTKVRVTLPAHAVSGARIELRTVADGKPVRVRERRTTLGSLELVELTPEQPLSPSTRYLVALVRRDQRPRTLVFGSFRTGAKADKTPPILGKLGPVSAHHNPRAIGSMCQTSDAWAVVRGIAASDPDRPSATLAFGVWIADASGRVDAHKPPTAILMSSTDETKEQVLELGNAHLCNPLKFPFPRQKSVVLGIAALDEAGNASAVRTLTVRFSSLPRTPP